jgi:hypothetical protein
MGYVLPVTPDQSIQYANRLQKNNASFSKRIWLIEKKSFNEEFESHPQSLELTSSSLQKRRKLQAAEHVYSKLTNKGLVINTRV